MLRAIIDPATLLQQLSFVSDLVSNVDNYESEYAQIDGTIDALFAVAGQAWVSAKLASSGVPNDADFQIRMPITLLRSSGVGLGCQIELPHSPIWRYEDKAQILAMQSSDVQIRQCPAPQITNSFAHNSTRLILSLDRLIDPASIQSSGAQFQFSGGIGVLSAKVYKNRIFVETSGFAANASYTVTIASSVRDYRGQSIDASGRSVQFTAIGARAILRINEVNLNISSGCDLIELRVLQGGNLAGYRLQNRGLNIIDLTGLTVQTNDYIVVHLSASSGTCNPGLAGNETSTTRDNAQNFHPNNFDHAYDWYSGSYGLARTDATLALFDQNGLILDAVLLSDDQTGTAATTSESAAENVAKVFEWTNHSNAIPLDGYYDDSFNANAVQDLDATAYSPSGISIQRLGDTDSDDSSGWTANQIATWGRNNQNQVNQ
jgi:hypothetical protein